MNVQSLDVHSLAFLANISSMLALMWVTRLDSLTSLLNAWMGSLTLPVKILYRVLLSIIILLDYGRF